MPRKYTIRSKEEKWAIVKSVLAGMPILQYNGNAEHTIMNWVKKYQAEGESGLEQKKKPGRNHPLFQPLPSSANETESRQSCSNRTGGLIGFYRVIQNVKNCPVDFYTRLE